MFVKHVQLKSCLNSRYKVKENACIYVHNFKQVGNVSVQILTWLSIRSELGLVAYPQITELITWN